MRSVQRAGSLRPDPPEEPAIANIPAPNAIRIGIAGAGANTRARHIPGLREIEGVNIVAVANRTRESGERVAREFGIDRVHDSWQELVSDPEVDAVVIGTWPNLHQPVTVAALAAGKHVLCEARMAMDASQAREMLEASRARPDLVAQLVPSPLSFSVDATIKRLLADGRLGEITSIDVAYRTGEFPTDSPDLEWRQDRSKSGNNVLALGIWYETLMRWVGRAESVFAMAYPHSIGSTKWDQRRLPDHLETLAAMEIGAIARIQMSASAGLNPSNSATLHGTEATLRFVDGALWFGTRADPHLAPLDIAAQDEGSWQVEEHFIESIRVGRPVTLTDFETGVAYMEFTDAVWESIAQGRRVDVPPAEPDSEVAPVETSYTKERDN